MNQCLAYSFSRILLFAALGITSGVAVAVEADPPKILINSLKSVVVIGLTDAGAPIAASDFKSFRFMADDSNYARMISVTPLDGAVRIAPTESFEVGTYDLVLETKRGTVSVFVDAPLSGEEGVLEQRTKALGGAKDEAMRDVGLATQLPRGAVKFSLAPEYLAGQLARIDIPESPGAVYRWLVNGEVVAEGAKALTFEYVFPAEGDYTVRLEQRSGRGEWEFTSEASTLVTERAPQAVLAKLGQRTTFAAPQGYGKYSWTLGEKPMGEQRTLGLAFPNPGKYLLSCRCEQPAAGPAGGFYLIRYEVTVP